MSSKEYCKVSPILYLDDLYIVRCNMQTRRDSLTHIFIFLYLERIWQRIIVDVWAFSYIRKYHTKTLHVLHLRERLQCYALTVFYPSFLVIEFLSLFWGVKQLIYDLEISNSFQLQRLHGEESIYVCIVLIFLIIYINFWYCFFFNI